MKIQLTVRNMGHVPTFKNAKRVVINHKTKKPFLATRDDVKKWMNQCIQRFELQLFCATLTTGDETLTAPPPRSLIASSLPLDDSAAWIPEASWQCEFVAPGEEGAVIVIEKIPNQ